MYLLQIAVYSLQMQKQESEMQKLHVKVRVCKMQNGFVQAANACVRGVNEFV